MGTLPTRAYRFCEAVVTASAFGYYVFPPITFSLLWDGSEITFSWEGADAWYPLKTVQFPGFREQFDAVVPEEVREFSSPWLSALQEPGIVQVWTGVVARTAPGWSLLVRAPANLPRSKQFDLYEGVIETDRWFGPLFTNVRLTQTNVPIEFRADWPLVQVQPLPRAAYDDLTLNSFTTTSNLEALTEQDWSDYHGTVVKPNIQEHRLRGQYAIAARKRRKGEAEASEES